MKIFKVFLLLLVIVLIVARLLLPHYLLQYVENQINKIPDYHAKIDDLDVALWRGSYTLVHIQLWKTSTHLPVPYFEAKTIDFSVQWSALLQGKFVAKIDVETPVINFVTDPQGHNEQISIAKQWLDIVKSLFPLNINRLEAHNGELYFRSYKGSSPFTTYVKNVEFTLENIQNAEHQNKELPSRFEFTGNPMGGGDVKVTGKFNPFLKTPTFYLKGELTSLSIVQIAHLLKHYTDLDVVGGTFSMYGEFGAADGKIKGYMKPFFKNLKIGDTKKESPLGVIYNGVASVAAKILENPKKKTVATQINLEGRIDDPNTSIFSIIGYMFHHAFIQALVPGIDHNYEMGNVFYNKNANPEEKLPRYRN
jgi:hypothetical protein